LHKSGFNKVSNAVSNAVNNAGLRQGLLTGIQLGLKLKFGLAGVALMTEIAQIDDVALLQTISGAIELADTPDQVRALYRGG
jgi:hypothetical protein